MPHGPTAWFSLTNYEIFFSQLTINVRRRVYILESILLERSTLIFFCNQIYRRNGFNRAISQAIPKPSEQRLLQCLWLRICCPTASNPEASRSRDASECGLSAHQGRFGSRWPTDVKVSISLNIINILINIYLQSLASFVTTYMVGRTTFPITGLVLIA